MIFMGRGNMREKRARWWNRLGGKPACHAASPRIEKCHRHSYSFVKRTKKGKLTYHIRFVKLKTVKATIFDGFTTIAPLYCLNACIIHFCDANCKPKIAVFRVFSGGLTQQNVLERAQELA
jgi:hypothetical protein